MSSRTFIRSPRMSDHEALMWTIEKDPWMNASGASLALLDQPVDPEAFQLIMRNAVVAMPRLYERVVPGLGRLSTPAWGPDPEFDLAYHVRAVELPAPGDQRALLELAARLYEEPLDRTRPLWRFVTISGLEGGKGAIYSMVHHVIADGIGQVRMAELYQTMARDTPPPAPVDLEGVVAAAVAAATPKEAGGAGSDSMVDTVRASAGHLARRQLGLLRRGAGEVAMWGADPKRAIDTIGAASELASSTIRQVIPSPDDDATGSSLWRERSRHRHLEWVPVDLAALKAAAGAVDASINDAFLAGLAEGAARYHADRGVPVQSFNSSFVISTRTDTSAGGNAFTPVPISLPGGPVTIRERLRTIHERTTQARAETGRSGGMGGLSGVLNQLPTSVLTRAARSAASKIDFATSNLRSAPFALYCAGAKVEAIVVMGPVAGTGANITAMSYDGAFNIGLFIDPQAINEPEALRDSVAAAFDDMIAELAPGAATETPASPATKKATGKKSASKKSASKKSAAKKSASKKTATKKSAAKKAASKSTASKKPAAKKRASKNSATKKSAAKKPAAKKTASKATSTKKASGRA